MTVENRVKYFVVQSGLYSFVKRTCFCKELKVFSEFVVRKGIF